MNEILEVKNLTKNFPVEKGIFRTGGTVSAAKDVSFNIKRGEIVALVGESGSGKSTIAKMIQGLILPSSGVILFNGRSASGMTTKERATYVQMIFQDPFASLNPKLSIGTMLNEAVAASGRKEEDKTNAESLLRSVGMPADILNYYPHQFSGGQRQRLGIARALAMKPQLIVADEPVSALDISIQAQILNLLMDFNVNLGVSYLLITHDLAIVEHTADRILVINNGRIVEEGLTENVFESPAETYTKKLLASVLTA